MYENPEKIAILIFFRDFLDKICYKSIISDCNTQEEGLKIHVFFESYVS